MTSAAKEYMLSQLEPALTKALVDLCREKPAEPVEFLAERLRVHKPPRPPTVTAPKGVALSVLLALQEEARARKWLPGPPGTKAPRADNSFRERHAGEPLTTADVCNEIVKPATASRRCEWIKLPTTSAAEIGQATHFVSHAWKYDFEELVSALEAARLPSSCRLWVDCLVVNQHVNNDAGFEWWSSTFRTTLSRIGSTLLVLAPWDAPTALARVWCLFTLLWAQATFRRG